MPPRPILALLVSILAVLPAAELRLARLFTDHAVLQREHEIPVWGWSDPGLTVSGTLDGSKASAKAGLDGRFELRFPKHAAGGPYGMTITAGSASLTISDILIGEVWVAGGQSNMLFSLATSLGGTEAIADAGNHPQLRVFHALFHPAKEPEADLYARKDRFVNGAWKRSEPGSVPEFSGVAYHFGRLLQERLQVPVGIIQVCWHSTPIEPWVPPGVLAKDFADIVSDWQKLERDFDPAADRDALHKQLIAQWEKARDAAVQAGKAIPPWPNKPPDAGTLERDFPGRLFNGMIAPVIPYAVRGVIWYQGESSAWHAWRYRSLFPAMVTGWRAAWDEDLPFLAVELAGWHGKKKSQEEPAEVTEVLPELREAQQFTAATVPGVHLASAVDLYDRDHPNDIHPKDKLSVATRLSLLARREVYGEGDLVASGPRFADLTITGGTVRLRFTSIGAGLAVRGGGELKGFALAGADQVYHWAKATIDGDTVVLSCDAVPAPQAAAYNWAAIPNGTLTNREDLPASGFRTDQWRRKTQQD